MKETENESVFRLKETEYAIRIGMSASYLQKDRMRSTPQHPFKRYGRSIRYPDYPSVDNGADDHNPEPASVMRYCPHCGARLTKK